MGYLQIASFLQASEEACVDMAGAVRTAIASFKSAGAVGVVVDLRGNGGGEDADVPNVLKYFASASFYYEVVALPRQTLIDLNGASATAGKTAVATADGDYFVSDRYLVTPAAAADRWSGGPVAVLVNRVVMSNGDMAANALKSLGASIVGFEGTSGSASMSGGKIACCRASRSRTRRRSPGTRTPRGRSRSRRARPTAARASAASRRRIRCRAREPTSRTTSSGAPARPAQPTRPSSTPAACSRSGLPTAFHRRHRRQHRRRRRRRSRRRRHAPPTTRPPLGDDEAGGRRRAAARRRFALAGGVLAAVIVAPVVVVVIIVALVVYCCCCRKQGATPTYAGKEAQPPAY